MSTTEHAEVLHGDNLELLRYVEDESIDAGVTDAPHGPGKPPPIAAVLHAGRQLQEWR